ncbi:MAG TPA: winged helix-turn-helix domain-containing protein [Steroidobacteraceae bacterium]|nr:winged helix-turn-helix domain-containing protein [Steroidobacteraceae bacterium]
MSSRKLRFDGWVFDPESGDLEREGARVRLQEQPARVLQELIAHPGSVVTREQLIALLWPKGVVDFDTGLNTAIRKLRTALGDVAETPRYIETLPRRGYRFLAALEPEPSDPVPAAAASASPAPAVVCASLVPLGPTPDAELAAPQEAAPEEAAPATRVDTTPIEAAASPAVGSTLVVWARATALAVAAAAIIALGYFGFDRWVLPRHAAPGGVSQSIAVLPLANESGDASQQYFSDGLSEDLITALSKLHGLRVIGRTSSFQFRDTKEDSRSIGAKLGVAHLVEGSVRRAGDMVRVSAELIDTSDGSTQWSERYDRPYKDLFALQDDITSAVAGALKTRLLEHERTAAASDRPPSGSLEAYNALLEGRFYVVHNTEADGRKAIELFTTATQLDPHYAPAWSELSWAWMGLGQNWLGGAPAQEAYATARAAADKALALAPDLAAAHLARAWWLLVADFDPRAAQAESRRALELAPDYGRAKLYLADELAGSGQLSEAIELARQALATDPLHANWYDALASYFLGLGRLDEAEAAVRKAIELQPNAGEYHVTLAKIAIQRGDAEAALSAAQQEPAGSPKDFALALARQISGDRTAAATALQLLIDKYADEQPYEIAEIYALRKDPDKMFEWLERALSKRDSGIVALLSDPFIMRYKDDPRLTAFCRKVGLPMPAEVERRG